MGRAILRVSLVVLLTIPIMSQCLTPRTALIRGKVIDNFQNPIEGVRVTIPGSSYEASTNGKGEYAIEYAPGNFTVAFDKPGYTSATLPLSLATPTSFPAQTTTLYLQPPSGVVSVVGTTSYTPLPRCAVNRKDQDHGFSWDKTTLSANWFVEGSPATVGSGSFRFADAVPTPLGLYKVPLSGPFYRSEQIGMTGRKITGETIARNVEFSVKDHFDIGTATLQPGLYAFAENGGRHLMGDEIMGDDPRVANLPKAGNVHCYLFQVMGEKNWLTRLKKDPALVADEINPGYYNLGYHENAPYQIRYSDAARYFTIVLLTEPIAEARRQAEQYLMEHLGLSESQLCQLNYTVGTVRWVNEKYAGYALRFSFCPEAVLIK